MLEVGAGSGIFAEQLKLQLKFKEIHGLDIINEAKLAAQRDRAGLYKKYYVEDLTDLSKAKEYELFSQKYNCIGVASATGWGNHVPAEGFERALGFLVMGGIFIFHVKPNDPDPECMQLNEWIRAKLNQNTLALLNKKRCFHRKSIVGTDIFYDAYICLKMSE